MTMSYYFLTICRDEKKSQGGKDNNKPGFIQAFPFPCMTVTLGPNNKADTLASEFQRQTYIEVIRR